MRAKLFWVSILLLVCVAGLTERGLASLAPALFILGDSTVDTGNQNYITSVVKSNFPPYGKDFTPPGPTGRFSNGKLSNDYIAEYLGLPYPINYLSPSATGSALLKGVNLASSGSGYLDITGQIFGVLNLTRQLENLVKVQGSIKQQVGQSATQDLIKNSIYLISTGSNDFINNYNINPALQEKYNPQQYQKLLVDSITHNLQTLYNLGARKVFIDSLGPIGCTPEQLNLAASQDGKCLERVNAPLRNFNAALVSSIYELRAKNSDYELNYANVYDTIYNFVQHPTENGYVSGNTACCGEGPYKGLPCINPVSDVCSNADDYIFWDLFHPSQRTYKTLADGFIYGDKSLIFPNNLQEVVTA